KKVAAPQAFCDRVDAVYNVGDKAKFFLSSPIPGEGTYRLSNDGLGTITEGKVNFVPGKFYSVTGTLAKPGFLQLRVYQGKETVLAAAAFDPTKIEPTAKMPADFDAFWEAGKKELA